MSTLDAQDPMHQHCDFNLGKIPECYDSEAVPVFECGTNDPEINVSIKDHKEHMVERRKLLNDETPHYNVQSASHPSKICNLLSWFLHDNIIPLKRLSNEAIKAITVHELGKKHFKFAELQAIDEALPTLIMSPAGAFASFHVDAFQSSFVFYCLSGKKSFFFSKSCFRKHELTVAASERKS